MKGILGGKFNLEGVCVERKHRTESFGYKSNVLATYKLNPDIQINLYNKSTRYVRVRFQVWVRFRY
ncbi:hypothetical protein Hanom_Chr01g00073481 [Helianthus anomalus]